MNASSDQPTHRSPGLIEGTRVLFSRELALERQTFAWLGAAGLLAIQEIVIIGLGFRDEVLSDTRLALSMAAIWLAFLFAGVVGINRSLGQENRDGAFDALLLMPTPRASIYLAKVISGTIFLCGASLVLLLGAGLFLNLPVIKAMPLLLPVMVLSAGGYVAIGTLLGSAVMGVRGREALLSVTILPLVVPLFLMATGAGRDVVLIFHEQDMLAISGAETMSYSETLGTAFSDVAQELGLLLAVDSLYLGLGILLYEKVVER